MRNGPQVDRPPFDPSRPVARVGRAAARFLAGGHETGFEVDEDVLGVMRNMGFTEAAIAETRKSMRPLDDFELYEENVMAVDVFQAMATQWVRSGMDAAPVGLNYVALTADHATPVGYGAHTGDPVPVIIGGPDVPASRILKLSEASAARGNLGRIRGLDLMPIITDLVGRSRLYGS